MDISMIITAIATVVSFAGIMTAVFRNFKMDIDKKFDEIKMEIREHRQESTSEFRKIDNRFNYIDQEINELRTSVNRLEGAIYSKDCCMLKGDKKTKKKAE